MRGFYMDEAFTGSPSDLQHISHDTNFTAKQWVDNTSASLAPIESTSTASQPYTVGKRLVYGGRLYKVTQAIAQGGTLTPGTNITEDNVSSEFDAINAKLTYNQRHEYGISSMVDISSYNSDSNRYTCPSDGYIELRSNTGTFAMVLYQENTGRQACKSDVAGINMPIYVRHNMVLRVNVTGDATAYFVPLSV